MKLLKKTTEKLSFVADMEVGLANAIRRSVGEISILAIDEVDIYKNDSALYDEVIAHRLGLVPITNQKLKKDATIEYKLKAKGIKEGMSVLCGELGKEVVYPDMPLVLLEEGQEIELVARARQGYGTSHAKFSPGAIFYHHLPSIKITTEGAKQTELATLYPGAFKLDSSGKVVVLDASSCHLDSEDLSSHPGVSITFDNQLVFTVESWGHIAAKDVFVEACKALKGNLSQVSKVLK